MTTNRGIHAYRRIEAESRSPVELVVLLYDGALRFLAEAGAAQARQDLTSRGVAVDRVLAIVAELQNTLNVEQGGAIAAELDRLYAYVNARLLDIALRQDAGALEEVGKILSTLREGWVQIASVTGVGQAGAAQP